MIVRILEEGQWDVPDASLGEIEALDDALSKAIDVGDAEEFAKSLEAVIGKVRALGTEVPHDQILPSDLMLPGSGYSLEETQKLLQGEIGEVE
ncbi:MAG: PspA-associated protein PspAA [Acidimicrobiales bacterium]